MKYHILQYGIIGIVKLNAAGLFELIEHKYQYT